MKIFLFAVTLVFYWSYTEGDECLLSEYPCNDGKNCLPIYKVCDGLEDCEEGEDEGFVCDYMGDYNPAENPCDNLNELHCNGTCVPLDKMCDGNKDCPEGDDEGQMCNNENPCDILNAELHCNGTCVPLEKMCDETKDCPEGNDEGQMCDYYDNFDNYNVGKVIGDETEKVTTTTVVTIAATGSDVNTAEAVVKPSTLQTNDRPTDDGVRTTETEDDVRISESKTRETTGSNSVYLFVPSYSMTLLLPFVMYDVACKI